MSSKLILIGGMSRSGKSSLAQAIQKAIPNTIHLDQDDFVLPENSLPRIDNRIDWELPETIDWNGLREQISIAESQADLIIIEGIFAFRDKEINQKADLKVYLNIEKTEFLEYRRLEERWGKEPEWYLDHVWQAHQKHKNPYQQPLDLVTSWSEQLHQEVISMIS